MGDRAFVAVVGLGAGFLLPVLLSELSASEWFKVIEAYQTLITGLLALFAALWGVVHVRRQMAQQDRIHQEQLGQRDAQAALDAELNRRKALAALPVDLSAMLNCAEANFGLLVLILNHKEQSPTMSPEWRASAFQLDEKHLERLIDVAGINDDKLARSVLLLVQFYQLMLSNTQGAIDEFERPKPDTIYPHDGTAKIAIKNVVEVWRRSEALFSVARGDGFRAERMSQPEFREAIAKISLRTPIWERVLRNNLGDLSDHG